jgi:hypothetical protein
MITAKGCANVGDHQNSGFPAMPCASSDGAWRHCRSAPFCWVRAKLAATPNVSINSKNHWRLKMLNCVPRLMLLAIAVSLLTACATANSDPACVCPPIKKYDREFQRKLADEIEAAPAGATFPVALQDYALVRQQISQCR